MQPSVVPVTPVTPLWLTSYSALPSQSDHSPVTSQSPSTSPSYLLQVILSELGLEDSDRLLDKRFQCPVCWGLRCCAGPSPQPVKQQNDVTKSGTNAFARCQKLRYKRGNWSVNTAGMASSLEMSRTFKKKDPESYQRLGKHPLF